MIEKNIYQTTAGGNDHKRAERLFFYFGDFMKMEKNKYIIYDSENKYLGIVSFEFPNLDEGFREFVNSMVVKLNFEIIDNDFLAIDKKLSLYCIPKGDIS